LLSRVSPDGAAAVAERVFLTPRRFARTRGEEDVLASARRERLVTLRADLAAWEWGPPAGPVVLFVHGWEGRGSQSAALVPRLVDRGFRVVAFDAPGHGDSPGSRASLPDFGDAVEAAARTFGPLHAVVSHSMGGAAVLWACRGGPVASRFVMLAPPIDMRDFTRALARMLGLGEDLRSRVHQRLAARFRVPLEAMRAEFLAPRMRAPLLVLHDEDDRDVPIQCGETMAAAWPGARLVKTQGLGHQRILRDAAALEEVVRFVVEGLPASGVA
jgi:pimeloyl-ACP methyl ester carboxylesterase